MCRYGAVLGAVLVAVAPSLCRGWSGDAHQIVALIAEDQLTPQAKAAATELLDGGRVSDAEVVNWADEIRRQRRETAPWHYVNIPVDAAGYDAQRDGKGGDTVIGAIEVQAKILADTSQPREKRADALKFVIHFVGDLHQPLHSADRGDRGGNTRLVMYPGQNKAQNLHTVWDRWLVRDLMGRRRVADVADQLSRTITPVQRKNWAQGDAVAWANEAHQVAVKVVYPQVPADGPPPTINRAYIDRATPAVAEQLKKAGVRLATVLNQALE